MAQGTSGVQFIRGFYDSWDQDYCLDLLRRFKIDPSDTIVSLSFGNKIKLSLVLALARHPKILILDEPTVGLDALSKREVFSQIMSLIGDGEHTVLISSHSLVDLERFTDHVGVIDDGRMILEGRTDEILESYRHVDFNLAGEPPSDARIVERDGDRVRVLTDAPEQFQEQLTRRGATGVSSSRVALEELFVSLVGKN